MRLLTTAGVLFALGCSGPTTTDTDGDVAGETSETGTESGHTGVPPHTGDTGPTLPVGLHGEPPAVPVPPLPNFEVLDTLGLPRGPVDLYNAPTVLLLSQGSGDGVAEVVGLGFEAVRLDLQALGVQVVAVTPQPVASNAIWRSALDLRFEAWSDPSVVLFAHYMVSQNRNETRLLDGEGNLVLVYDTDMIALDMDGHADNVLEDVQLLWGDGTR